MGEASEPSADNEAVRDKQASKKASSEATSSKPKKKLTASQVFVRIRPIGERGHGAGEASGDKTLHGWTEQKVVVADRKNKIDFKFPKRVMAPEASQVDACDTLVTNLLPCFWGSENVHFFAYGQTGSGKTHTMFGPNLSCPEEWGLMPRVIDATLRMMDDKRHEFNSMLLISAVEFVGGFPFDLNVANQGRPMCEVDIHGQVTGNVQTIITSASEFGSFLSYVMANRCTMDNGMNAASSRSHVAIILNLLKIEKGSGLYTRTCFNLVDLAGSERARKVKGGEGARGNGVDMSTFMLKYAKMFRGEFHEFTVHEQGMMINMDLNALGHNVQIATQAHARGKKYNPPTQCSSPSQNFLMGCCDGQARLGMCVCLSQSPQNGFESYESLKFGETLAKLRVPIRQVKSVKVDKQRIALENELAEAKADLAKANTTAFSSQFHSKRMGRVHYAEQMLSLVAMLQGQGDA